MESEIHVLVHPYSRLVLYKYRTLIHQIGQLAPSSPTPLILSMVAMA
jgi:hypothetical protein